MGSVIHAADKTRRGCPDLDQRLDSALADPVSALTEAARSADLAEERLWRFLLPISCLHDDAAEVAARLGKELGGLPGPDAFCQDLAKLIETLAQRMDEASPGWRQQLVHRQRPLREHWETIGPGLISQLSEQLRCELKHGEAKVHMVHPASGGGGGAHPHHGSIRIEAVLTNSLPQLPETLRMAWLLGQLVVSPVDHESLPFALLAATLAAAAAIDVIRFDDAVMELALTHWDLPSSDRKLGPRLRHWWEGFSQSHLTWDDGLRQLSVSLRR